ncbi:MAG: CPBP family intramembrane metalloprotease [Nitrospirota bacterium]|nr:CPBP family intramembrane metalloprotease [Nitrospirota bacterium]
MLGIVVSIIVLAPFYVIFSFFGKSFGLMPLSAMAFQLLGISFPEEIFFRGFLQERFGNNIKGLLIVSILFSLMHMPQFIFYGDIYSLFTFFPSLIMGILYMKTSNVLPSTIFHFLSNVIFLGFYGSN